MRRQTASRRWKSAEPYRDSKSFTGLQDYKLAASWASRRLNRISHKHDADYTNYLHPYITYTKADENWIRRSYADNSYTAAAGQLYFGLKKALLPRSRRDWSTILKRPRLAPPPRLPSSLRPPTETHRTTNLVQSMPKYGRRGRISYLGSGAPLLGARPTLRDLAIASRRSSKYDRRRARNFRRGNRSSANFRHLMNCVETKYKDQYQLNHQAQLDGNPVDLLDAITGGDDANKERIGNKIFLRSIHLNGTVAATDNVSSPVCQTLRLMIVQDKMALGTTPTAAQLLDMATITIPTKAYRQLDQTSRFNVLFDKKIAVEKPVTDKTGGLQCKNWKFSKAWPQGLHVTYDSSAGLTANIVKNNLWVFAFSDTTTNNLNPTCTFSARIRYTD